MVVLHAAVVFMLPLGSGMIVLWTLKGSNWRSEQMELVLTCLQRNGWDVQPGQVGCHGLVFTSTNSTFAVMFVAHHRWLGPVWPADLRFRLVLAQRLGVASGIVAQVAGMYLAIDPKSNKQ